MMLFNGEMCRTKLVQWSKNMQPDRLIENTKKQIMKLRRGLQTEEVRVELE